MQLKRFINFNFWVSFSNYSSEIVLGEHELGRDPDCQKFKGSEMCSPPKITRTVAKVIVHEKYVGTSDGVYIFFIFLLDTYS